MIADRVSDALVWHELECGGYRADLGLWLELAAACPGPVLDVGAGAGRVAGALFAAGADVIALDVDAVLLDALRIRWPGVRTVVADAREFSLSEDVGLVLVPMQTIQLLGARDRRAGLLACARAHLRPGGLLACAVADELEPFGPAARLPEPERTVRGGAVYESQLVALRAQPDAWELERRRSVHRAGAITRSTPDVVRLERISPDTLRAEGESHGLAGLPHRHISPTPDHTGSTVVIWRG